MTTQNTAIGYPGRQDGALIACCPLQQNSVLHAVSIIDQVCLLKMAGYWPRSLFDHLETLTAFWSIPAQNPIQAHT